jgi:hypothetical protein
MFDLHQDIVRGITLYGELRIDSARQRRVPAGPIAIDAAVMDQDY